MATITKRGNGSWRVQIRKKGIKKYATFDTKAQAKKWADQIEAKIYSNDANLYAQNKSVNDPNDVLLTDLFKKYSKEISPTKRGVRWEQIRLNFLAKYEDFHILVSDVNSQLLASWRNKRLLTVSPATVNRELNLISAVFNIAIKEWGVNLPNNPVHMIQRPQDPKSRDRRVTDKEKKLIAYHLGWDMVSEPKTSSQWTAFAFFLAIETAMRRGEIVSFKWKDVYLEKSYIHLEMTKNGEFRNVPLSSAAKKLINLLTPKEQNDFVVPMVPDVISSLFRRAALEAGIRNLHFHDSRREATTRLSKKLSNILELSAFFVFLFFKLFVESLINH